MQSNKDLSNYRLEKATESLRMAKTLLATDHYNGAASSSYFCVFHGIRSVLALENVDFKKHSAVIAYFCEHYIKTSKFSKELSDIVRDLFNIRSKSDYDDFYVINKEDVVQQIKHAEYFLTQIKAHLATAK
jgi:uncharacterized protein (UPF0332 family)